MPREPWPAPARHYPAPGPTVFQGSAPPWPAPDRRAAYPPPAGPQVDAQSPFAQLPFEQLGALARLPLFIRKLVFAPRQELTVILKRGLQGFQLIVCNGVEIIIRRRIIT